MRLFYHFSGKLTASSGKDSKFLDASDQTSVRLSQQERTTLCSDILRFSLLLGREAQGENGESLPAVIVPEADSSPWERLLLLSGLWPRLDTALHSIAAAPDMAAQPALHSLPIYAVQGGPDTLTRLARSPADYRAWTQATRQEEPPLSARIQEQRSAHTVETPPNRIAADFLESLAQESQALRRLALFCDEPAAADAAARLAQRARYWLRQSPFCRCTRLARSGQACPTETLLRCAPAYHSLYTVIRQSRCSFHVDWSESAALRFPILEAWHLYEIWCFLRVGIALRDLGWQSVETDCLQVVQAGMRLRLAHGRASRIRFRRSHRTAPPADTGTVLELLYQPLFASAHRTSSRPQTGFRSLSHVMQPDIALVQNGRILLLDPKYRSYGEAGQEQEDVDKMHTYRDAIVRTDANTGQTVPVVDAAWCLFPGLPQTPGVKLQRLRAYPAPAPDEPFGTAGVGAVQVRPGADNPELGALLHHWLESFG